MLLATLFACLFAFGFESPAVAAPTAAVVGDVSGEWTGEVATPVSYSPIPMYFKLQQKGDDVTGTAGPGPDSQFPIAAVKRSGNAFHFSVSGEGLTYTFDLVVEDDTLRGEATGEDRQSHKWGGKASLTRATAAHK